MSKKDELLGFICNSSFQMATKEEVVNFVGDLATAERLLKQLVEEGKIAPSIWDDFGRDQPTTMYIYNN